MESPQESQSLNMAEGNAEIKSLQAANLEAGSMQYP